MLFDHWRFFVYFDLINVLDFLKKKTLTILRYFGNKNFIKLKNLLNFLKAVDIFIIK